MTETKGTLAVLITYHNEREMLTECLQSLIQGGSMPDEILIYDDASKFPPQPYIPPGLRVTVVSGTGQPIGPSRGRNILWRATACEYVHFQDADDLFAPTWCRKTRAVLNQGYDVIFAEISTFDSQGIRVERLLHLENIQKLGLLPYCLQNPLLVNAGTYRISLVRRIGGYRETLWQCEDYDFHVRIAAQEIRYTLMLAPLTLVRQRDDSRSHNLNEVAVSTLQAIELLANELDKKNHPDLCEAAATTGIRSYREGLSDLAQKAFKLAHRIGRPTYGREWFFYRAVAKTLGPMAAEKLSAVYRKTMSNKVRFWIRKTGDAMGLGSRRKTYY